MIVDINCLLYFAVYIILRSSQLTDQLKVQFTVEFTAEFKVKLTVEWTVDNSDAN